MPPDKRQQILTVAAMLFARQGYHKTTVTDIAREAEVAQGTVYLYFDSKKAIFSALVDQTLELFTEVQLEGMRMRELQTLQQLKDGLPRMYRHVLGIFADNPTLVRLMFTEVRGADSEIEAKLAAFYERVVQDLAMSIQIGITKGFFRPDVNPKLAAHCLIGIMERFANLVLAQPEADLDAMAHEIAQFELTGIAIPPAGDQFASGDEVQSL